MTPIDMRDCWSTRFNRLDHVQMSAPDRTRAEALLLQGEALADVLLSIEAGTVAVVRSTIGAFEWLRTRVLSALPSEH